MTKLISLFPIACALVFAAIPQPIQVTGGRISGAPGRDASITAFKGIPFAAPPVGELRWRAPQPVIPWPGVKAADRFGASCMQTIVTEKKPWTYEFMAHNDVSEDCLYLNVWTAAKSAGEKRPVYFFIYGGGFNEGSTAVPAYDGEGLAKKGLVVVTINYRVGIFGFFAHPELTRESATHSSGNYGLLDQVAALQWVRDNIAKFGGDPARVTVAGQSAGASSVNALIASPLAKGLFARAIAESGTTVAAGAGAGGTKLAQAEQTGAAFATAKGVKSIAELRAMSWEKLTEPVQGGGRGGRGGLIVDGSFLPMSVAETLAQGKQNDVPTLTGWNKGESGATPNPTITAAAFQAQAKQRYGERADEFLKLYPADNDERARISQNESSWDQQRTGTYLWARGRAKTAKTNAYTYFWDHTLPGPDAALYGAFHTSEVPYVLNTLYMSERPFTDADRKIADQVSSYWANFAATGDPNGKGLAAWPAVGEKPETMEIGDKPGAIPAAGSPEKFAFWEKFLTR
jgi:para-nitrobenzyl esterase